MLNIQRVAKISKFFAALFFAASHLNFFYNYFDGPTKLFLNRSLNKTIFFRAN